MVPHSDVIEEPFCKKLKPDMETLFLRVIFKDFLCELTHLQTGPRAPGN